MVGLQVIDLSTPDGGIRNLLLASQSDSEFSMSGVGEGGGDETGEG
jgi:hypothetical protein